ncbi:TrkH family potassium uptake protein [Endozoicomonadaceae bacterium StTr2]
MSIRPVLYVLGIFLVVLSVLMLCPALYDLLAGETGERAFAWSALMTFIPGLVLAGFNRVRDFSLKPRQIFLMTNATWLTLSSFAALPFWLKLDVSYTDAFFETMSGITTTGSTVLSGLDTMNKGILLWRSLLQWLGGIGFIVIAVAVLPFLKVGGMRLFQSESSDWSDKAMPRSGSIAKRIILVYLALTVGCTLLYMLYGMDTFEAINHSMTTVSTGGYSTSDSSMGHFTHPGIFWTSTLFMILSSLPFVLFVKFLRGDTEALARDSQVRKFVGFLLFIFATFSLWLYTHSDHTFFESLTLVAFNTTSVITTTGYAYTDYTLWGGFAATLFFFLTFVGGCSGSTAGGFKIFRFEIGAKLLSIQLKQVSHPKACIVQVYNGQQVTSDILRSLIGFSFFFGLLVCVMTLLLSLLGLDFVTALSGAATAVANVGPGLGETIGPAGNFASLPDTAKWILSLGMLMGRLEVITVLVMFTIPFWEA